jgi:hypothetical protein
VVENVVEVALLVEIVIVVVVDLAIGLDHGSMSIAVRVTNDHDLVRLPHRLRREIDRGHRISRDDGWIQWAGDDMVVTMSTISTVMVVVIVVIVVVVVIEGDERFIILVKIMFKSPYCVSTFMSRIRNGCRDKLMRMAMRRWMETRRGDLLELMVPWNTMI